MSVVLNIFAFVLCCDILCYVVIYSLALIIYCAQGKLTKLRAKVMVMASSKAEATSTAQSIVNDLDTHLMDAITDFNEFGASRLPLFDKLTTLCCGLVAFNH